MKSKFHDPNNHVPEVTEADEWGDGAAEDGPSNAGSHAMLPRKRKVETKPAFREVKQGDGKGLEITPKKSEKKPKAKSGKNRKTVVQRLEVQEHVAKRLGGRAATPAPEKVVPKLVAVAVAPEIPTEDEWIARAPDSENWGKQKTVPMRWIIVSGSVLAAVIITLAVFLPKMGWKEEKRATSFFKQIEVDSQPDAPKTPAGSESFDLEGTKVAVAYGRARTVDQVLGLVRNRAKVEPLIRSQWQSKNLPENWKLPDNVEWMTQVATDQQSYGVLRGMLPDGGRFQFYFTREDGRVVIDWEASEAISETPFAGLSKNQGEGGVTRCLLSPGDFYSFSLPERDYQCFRLASPDQEVAIWGYAQRGTPLAEQLVGLFQQGAIPREIPPEYQIAVRLAKAPADSTPNQWIITEMLHIDWLTP